MFDRAVPVQEARSRAAACARASTPVAGDSHAAVAHELDIARRQLAEARAELEGRRAQGACGSAERDAAGETPPRLRQGPLWSPSTTAHSQDSQHRFNADHAVLAEQVWLSLLKTVLLLQCPWELSD